MVVCGHGDVSDFCKKHDMIVMQQHDGDIESYRGVCRVLVTDRDMSEQEYYFLKGKMLAKGIELISTKHKDTEKMSEFMVYASHREIERRGKYTGRYKFGFHRVGDEVVPHPKKMEVVKRILELRDKGCTYRSIREDRRVRHIDGRKLSISTIALIVQNREYYEKDWSRLRS